MKELKVPVKGGVRGHISTMPVGRKGVFWAVNCTPYDDGMLMWRPNLQRGTLNTDYVEVFDPSNETLLDMLCWYDSILFLVKVDTYLTVRRWVPGNPVASIIYTFPLPTDSDKKNAQLGVAGNYATVAIEGYGIYVMNSYLNVFRIGSLFYTSKSTSKSAKNFTGSGDIVDVTAGDKIFIGTITVYMTRMELDKEFSFRLKITAGSSTYVSLETYDQNILPASLEGMPGYTIMYAPIVFTFEEEITPPFTVSLEKISGDLDLHVEAASKLDVKSNYSVSFASGFSPYPHMYINGTLDPNGGVVGCARGMIAGVYNGQYIQFADTIDFEFVEEAVVDYPVVELNPFGQGMVAVTKKAVFSISGWSHSSISVEKVAETGVTGHFDTIIFDKGILCYTWGRLEYYSLQGAAPINLPFVYQLPENARMCYLPEWEIALIGFDDFDYSLVINLKQKWAVWWRFDEIGKAVPLRSCNGVVTFSNGYAYAVAAYKDSSWAGYKSELGVSTGVLADNTMLTVNRINIDGGLWITSSSDASLNLIACSRYGIQAFPHSLPPISSPASNPASLMDISGEGLYYQVPSDKARLAYIQNTAIDTVSVLEGSSSFDGFFPTGNGFIIELVLNEGCEKHPAGIVENFNLYVEEVGSAL